MSPRRAAAGQGALDLGEAFAPPKPKITKPEAWRRHVEAGLCRIDAGWRTPEEWCTEPAVARPAIGAVLAIGCEGDEEEDFVAFGEEMCRAHASELAESWFYELWQPPVVAETGWYVDSNGSEWLHPCVWVELAPAPATAYPASTIEP